MAPLDTEPGARPVALFLDRDGVINRRAPVPDYIRNWSEFELTPGALEALAALQDAGAALLIVTNQRGVARGLVDRADLDDIHARLVDTLSAAGVSLGGIYVCPHEIGTCDCRKPGTGLFTQAQLDHPWIAFERSHLVGDSISDIEAGQRLGMHLWVVGDDRDGVAEEATERGMRLEAIAPTISDLVAQGALVAAIAAGARR